MAPTKKLIVCCDGTWNDSDGTELVPTNVVKIARCLNHRGAATDKQGNKTDQIIPQLVFYQSGIGSKSGGPIEAAFDGFTGRGIEELVRQAYGFICNNYGPDDEIHLIGFSRGAYTVRVISALINDVGLLTKHTLGYFSDVFHAWQQKNLVAKHDPGTPPPVSFSDMKAKLLNDPSFTQGVRIKVCAVFDTVGSLGIPVRDGGPFGLPQDYLQDILRATRLTPWLPWTAKGTEAYSFVDTVVSPNIDFAFQALALDEHRDHFDPTIWEDPDRTTVKLKQCWFVGCHSHIGGGVRDNDELPNITLAWMIDQLSQFLSIDHKNVNFTKADAPLQATLEGLNMKGEPIPKGEFLTDSKKGMYLFDGSTTRTPMQYRSHRLDPATGKSYVTPPLLQNSAETIHKSVRVRFWKSKKLLKDGKEYQPFALKDLWKPGAKDPYEWPYIASADIGPLPEDIFTDSERQILKDWSMNSDTAKHLEEFDLTNATR